LQAAALAFADASTKDIKVSDKIIDTLLNEFKNFIVPDDPDAEQKAQDLLVETAAVVSTYNMVSRFLVSLDVAGKSDEPVPWPVDREEVHAFSRVTVFDLNFCTAISAHGPNSEHIP
jgi:hypothetical protein